MAIGQQLTLKQQQRLTQMQIQQIKLLEIPALEMEERVLQEIDSNPALEYGEDPDLRHTDDEEEDGPFENENDFDGDDSFDQEASSERDDEESPLDSSDDISEDYMSGDDDRDDYEVYDKNTDENKREPYMGVQTATLHDFLKQQLSDLDIDERQHLMAEYLIGNVDEDGYLRSDTETICDQISFQTYQNVSVDELNEVLKMIQEFEPAGVAAKDLQECLLLQLNRKNQTPEVQNAICMLSDCFDDFSMRHYDKICQSLHFSEEVLNAAIKEITKLNPKPGNDWESSALNETSRQIMPDFLLENHEGKLLLSLNDTTIPELHISHTYRRLLHDYQANPKKQTKATKEAALFAKQKIDSANWFIDAIRQRQRTLLSTMQAIVDRQEAFFLSGEDKKMRPMKLKDIADVTGYDISTISRVSNSKYIQTEFGIFSLKYFFGDALQTESGEEVSVMEIKTILKEIVSSENKKKPYTDDQLVSLLKAKGYQIARRTVAKYREQLAIPTSRLRVE